VEGCYIPIDWKDSFSCEYLQHIRGYFLIMSEGYIADRYQDIIRYRRAIEDRLPADAPTKEELIRENAHILRQCKEQGCGYILIDDRYDIDLDSIAGI